MKTMTVLNRERLIKEIPNCPESVPFELLNEKFAMTIHGQTLDQLNNRGGLSVREICGNVLGVDPEKLPQYSNEWGVTTILKWIENMNRLPNVPANPNLKSVIKLDKNFHIYIHGSHDLIHQGIDPDTGKKFYKIFYDNEE